jgi:hypothetical protein
MMPVDARVRLSAPPADVQGKLTFADEDIPGITPNSPRSYCIDLSDSIPAHPARADEVRTTCRLGLL